MVQSYCANEVRLNDYERYLSALFIPSNYREAVFGIYAFNSEVARTREMVNETMLGEIRLQWWRDSIQKIFLNHIVEHPILDSLRKTVILYDIPIVYLENLLDARSDDLKNTPPTDLESLVDYATKTSGVLGIMVMKILGYDDMISIRVANLVSTAWALIGLIRSIQFHAQSERLYLPSKLLIENNVDDISIFRLQSSMELSSVVREVINKATDMLCEARSFKNELPRTARKALLLGPLADCYLKDIIRAKYDPFTLSNLGVTLPIRLVISSILGRY